MANNYRPDRWARVEGRWRTAPPSQELINRASKEECLDCNVNVFIEEDPEIDGHYIIKVAHDDTCPWIAEHGAGERRRND